MFKRPVNKALTFILAASLATGCMDTAVLAAVETKTTDDGIVVEIDPAITKAVNSSSVSTGTQTDAIQDREDEKQNNPSEYDKLDADLEENIVEKKPSDKEETDDDSQDDESEEEIAVNWQIVHISTADDLKKLAKSCMLDSYSADKKVYLDNDISLTDTGFTGIPYFNGYFYGQDHTISNLLFDEERSYMGLFSRVGKKALISDLNVSGRVTPQGAQTIVGGVAGDNEGIITNCSFDGISSGEDYVGGIAGINELSGIIMECTSEGVVSGTHFTGGIAGENMGNIVRCTNESAVNITNKDSSVSVEDISVESIMSMAGIGDTDKDEAEASAMVNGTVDMGGIAGVSIGVIQYCINDGAVGYTNVGYNVGGIAGRQSGYIYSCTNNGKILGRKDVGGIVGQAEPYVTIDFANDITSQLSENIEKLHDILEVTLNDADSSSDTISSRLSVIKNFTDLALDDTKYIENETIDWANGMVSSANEALSRIDYIMDESAKKDGVMDKTNAAASDAKTAMSQFDSTVKDLDIYKYMTDEEKIEYDNAKAGFEAATSAHAEYESDLATPTYNYAIRYYINQAEYNGTNDPSKSLSKDEKNVKYKKDDDTYTFEYTGSNPGTVTPSSTSTEMAAFWYSSVTGNYTDNKTTYDISGNWVHHTDGSDDVNLSATDNSDQNSLDSQLVSAATSFAASMATDAADAKYLKEYGTSYSSDIEGYVETMAGIIAAHSSEMTDATKTDADKAIKSLESSMNNLQSAGSQAKSIVDTLNNKSDISLPAFSEEYKQHANSLTNNIQGMSDNFGLLNSEMNGASDELVDDLKGVNDQFNVIMQLFTDAVDGVLDNDYSNTYTDGSLEVCNTTTDATVDACENTGDVEGSIDVSGICGTMAIEYDFDLESDVTGVKDAAMNKSYQTKCVLRNDKNDGLVTAQKNYAGGICGLQEMGTITGGQNYNTVKSSTASYVGGIAGSSVSNIVRGYSKCTLSGKEYVGGIVGDGARIYDSFSMVVVEDATGWYGAIAGHVDDDSDVKNNYFVSSDLAGIDRVSYEGQAEPVSYSYAEQYIGSVSTFFKNVYIKYILDEDLDDDDNETVTLDTVAYNYGQAISEDEYPEVPEKEGYYVQWDVPSVDALVNDIVITATYIRYNTTLASEVVRGSNQSAILVDGDFKEEDTLDASLSANNPDALPDSQEYWTIVIPDDGNLIHMVRYMKADNMDDWPAIYMEHNGSWEKISEDDISTMGSYETFYVNGNDVKLQMTYSDAKKQLITRILIIVGSVIGAVLLIMLIVMAFKTRKRVRHRVRRQAKAIIEKAEAREPAIKFVDENSIDEPEDTEEVLLEDENASDKQNDSSTPAGNESPVNTDEKAGDNK